MRNVRLGGIMRHRIACWKCGWEVEESEAYYDDSCPPRWYCRDCFEEWEYNKELSEKEDEDDVPC